MTLGGPDPSGFLGSFTSHNLVTSENTWWTVNYTGSSYDGVRLNTSPLRTVYAIIDTGTSFFSMPDLEYINFSAALTKAGFYCPSDGSGYCEVTTKTCEQVIASGMLKDLTVSIDNIDYVIPPLGYCDNYTSSTTGSTYAIIPIDRTYGHASPGDTFLRNYYTLFNYKENTVSFALNAANAWNVSCTTTSGTTDSKCPSN
jgi:hypothetical protein